MSDELLTYYRNELSFIRRMAAEFADDHPRMAERLRLNAEGSADPHVERMIEAFAFLTARIRRKLDDEFPEITQALLDVLYPHYLAPIPSMAIAQFHLDRGQADLLPGLPIPRHALIDSEETADGPCKFRTCYPVTLYPFDVESASLRPIALAGPGMPKGTSAMLKIDLRCFGAEAKFGAIQLDKLRFFLRAQEQHAYLLYEMLVNDSVEVALASSPDDPYPTFIGASSIQPVGFDKDEAVLPYTARSFPGYRLLSEYFAFPRKFLFIDIHNVNARTLAKVGNRLELRIYLKRSSPDLEQNVAGDTFRLGCTPIVNLFPMRAEPITLTQTTPEYRIVPDSRRPTAFEIYTVDRVVATSPQGEEVPYVPFYSIGHGGDGQDAQPFWQSSRRPSTRQDEQVDRGTEMFLSFADVSANPLGCADWTVDVECTCLNRDLPAQLPSGGGRPNLTLVDGGPVTIECLSHPSPTLRPPLGDAATWRLISHLSLNHLSLGDAAGSPEALREILKLYDYVNQAESQAKISSLLNIRHRRIVGRAGGVVAGGFCRGVEVAATFDEEKFSDNGLFLFASVLERFVGLYCSINTFTQFVANSSQRQGEIRRWAPRVAERVLL